MGRGERVKGNCIGYQIMTAKAILSGSPKLPSDLKGHKTHPKKPSHGKAKQSPHLSPARRSCAAVPGLRAALTHSSRSRRDGAAPDTEPAALPRQQRGLRQPQSSARSGTIRAGSGHSPPPRARTDHYCSKLEGGFAPHTHRDWTRNLFVRIVGGCHIHL